MRMLIHIAAVAVALQAPPKPHGATRLAATQQLDVGCWMLLVPELNDMPGRNAYDVAEFLTTKQLRAAVEGLDECAVLSTCDRYCVFVASDDVAAALDRVAATVTREIAIRCGRSGGPAAL